MKNSTMRIRSIAVDGKHGTNIQMYFIKNSKNGVHRTQGKNNSGESEHSIRDLDMHYVDYLPSVGYTVFRFIYE